MSNIFSQEFYTQQTLLYDTSQGIQHYMHYDLVQSSLA